MVKYNAMRKKSILIIFCFVFSLSLAFIAGPAAHHAHSAALANPQINSLKVFEKGDRVLILAPHPDDEAIGCAGVIQQALRQGAAVHVAYLTNGDHNQVAFMVYEKRLTFRKGEFIHMGEVRRKEATKAMKLLGLKESDLTFLGYPDFGTFAIFRDYWQSTKPFKSLLTRVSHVPYKNNLSFGAPYTGESALDDMKKVIREYKPNKIFVTHPADVNYDHKTFHLFLEIALADLNKELPRPEVYSYLIHWRGWPLPRHYHPELGLAMPDEFSGSRMDRFKYDLPASDLEKKHQAILCYKSQTESSAFYLLAFARKNELFSIYPEINAGLQDPKDCMVKYSVENGALLMRIGKEKGIKNRFNMMVYLFGYSHNKAFAKMPKIRITSLYKKFRVFDGKKMLNVPGVVLEFAPEEVILRIPLSVLGDPDFVLASVKDNSGLPCVDNPAFRKINVKGR